MFNIKEIESIFLKNGVDMEIIPDCWCIYCYLGVIYN